MLELFRLAVAADDLDKDDWDSLRVAVRMVYETEQLSALLHGKRRVDAELAINTWSDTIEACLEFISWTKCLAGMASGATRAKSRRRWASDTLWERHRAGAAELLDPKLSPQRRISVLAELGGLELSLLGHMWWTEPSAHASAAVSAEKPGRARAAR